MKRLLIVPIVIGAMLFALPALAKKPPKPPPTTTTTLPPASLATCVFTDRVLHYQVDGDDGDWVKWNGDEALWCDWAPTESPGSMNYKFEIQPVGARSFIGPYLLLKDAHPGAEFCYRDWYNGKQTDSVMFPKDGGFIHLPGDGVCGDPLLDHNGPFVFTITVYVTKAQGGAVQLVMLEP